MSDQIKQSTSMWREPSGILPHSLALGYVVLAHIAGLWLIMQPTAWLVIPGILLTAHSMVIGAYLVHECAHNTIFTDNDWNQGLGAVLLWLVGSAYSDYEDVRHKHFRHHVDKADVVAFDYRTRLAQRPALARLIQALEWAYIPAVDIMMHALVLILPFTLESRKHRRRRVLLVLLSRVAFFAILASISWQVLIFYPIAYMLFMHVMRFMDAHQHTFEVFETLDQERGEEARRFDRAYEHRNTYSNLFSSRYPWLNLLVLNFGYHNAHHQRPTVPWYRLPAFHAELYGEDESQMLPFNNLLASYHRYRVRRALHADEESDAPVINDRGRTFVGVDGVSFLTTH
jgi:fatty acid desaturase